MRLPHFHKWTYYDQPKHSECSSLRCCSKCPKREVLVKISNKWVDQEIWVDHVYLGYKIDTLSIFKRKIKDNYDTLGKYRYFLLYILFVIFYSLLWALIIFK